MLNKKSRACILWLLFAAATVFFIFSPCHNNAQEVANGLALANVLTALSVTAVQDLNFGDVYQGVGKAVPNNDALNSGVFVITGQSSAGISVYITLPPYLATATGDDRMDVTFDATDCSIDSTGNSDPSAFGDGWPNVNPYNLPNNLVIGSAVPSQTAMFLGGRVTPSVDQTAGPYSGDIIVTVAYTGT